jgi:transposase-like protein
LSYADVVEWFAEWGLDVDRSTVSRWVQRFLPLFGEAARSHRRPVGEKWRVDETYLRLQGHWTYVYRAIDEDGQVVDAYFSERRNAQAAQKFFERAIDETGVKPDWVTTDKAKCYPPALHAVLPGVEHRTSKYLNNGIERDQGHLKQRLYPMRGFGYPPGEVASADIITRRHALVRNVRNGFSSLTLHVAINLRLAVSWPQLTLAI